MYFDIYYLILIVPALILSIYAQIKVKVPLINTAASATPAYDRQMLQG